MGKPLHAFLDIFVPTDVHLAHLELEDMMIDNGHTDHHLDIESVLSFSDNYGTDELINRILYSVRSNACRILSDYGIVLSTDNLKLITSAYKYVFQDFESDQYVKVAAILDNESDNIDAFMEIMDIYYSLGYHDYVEHVIDISTNFINAIEGYVTNRVEVDIDVVSDTPLQKVDVKLLESIGATDVIASIKDGLLPGYKYSTYIKLVDESIEGKDIDHVVKQLAGYGVISSDNPEVVIALLDEYLLDRFPNKIVSMDNLMLKKLYNVIEAKSQESSDE